MASRATWKGALEVAGFPVNVELHNRIKSKSGESFKTLGTDDKPIRMVMVESGEFEKLEKDPHTKVSTIGRNDTRKGVPHGDGFTPLPKEAVETIQGVERSKMLEPASFAPVDSLPLELADKAFAVVPDSKVPGSEKSVNLIWNGLRARGLAYLATVTLRSGSPDTILAVYATDEGLFAVGLPFEGELNENPSFEYAEDAKAAEMFGQFVDTAYDVAPFDHTAFTSTYRERRRDAIEAVLEGKEIEVPDEAPASEGPDLAAVLEQAVEAKKPKAKAKPKAKKAASRKKVAS
jgi:non-homologous end joining protein Ku